MALHLDRPRPQARLLKERTLSREATVPDFELGAALGAALRAHRTACEMALQGAVELSVLQMSGLRLRVIRDSSLTLPASRLNPAPRTPGSPKTGPRAGPLQSSFAWSSLAH